MLKKLTSLVSRNAEQIDLVGPQDEDAISHAELEMGWTFPAEVRSYIQQWGQFDCGPLELCGLGVLKGSHIDIVSVTKEAVAEGLPKGFVAIQSIGDGHIAVCAPDGRVYDWAPQGMDGQFKQIALGFESYVLEALRLTTE